MPPLETVVITVGVTEIIKRLLPVIEEHSTPLIWGLKGDLKKLKKALDAIEAAVSDADQINSVKNNAASLWLRRLKGVVYDADDVMDQYLYETIRRDENGRQLNHKVRDFVSFSSSNLLVFRFRIAGKIRAINKTLDEIHKENKRYNRPITAPGINFHTPTEIGNKETYSGVNDSKVITREDAKSEIISMMLDSMSTAPRIPSSSGNSSQQAKLSIASIVGMGGLGKTVLAQLIYKDSNLGNFDSKSWVCVSDNFLISNILVKMIDSINGTKFDKPSNLDALGTQVSKILNGKHVLLVLDDLWNEVPRDWEKLTDILVLSGAKSITILITTRSSKVASIVGGRIYELQRLTNDACWSIMEKIILVSSKDKRVLTNEAMTTIGKDIAERCDGLPLGANFLGTLMAKDTKEDSWLKIKDDPNLWNARGGYETLQSIIKLSYDHLSSPSKQCFSYCSMFPKDWVIERQMLIRLWMAEGFLQPSDESEHRSIEDIGNDSFELLLSNSFFQDTTKDELGVATTCMMHDLVHDFAESVVKLEEYGILQSSDSEIRRLQLVCGEASSSTTIPSKAKKLRTVIALAPKNCSQINSFFSNKRLRVLCPLGDWGSQICTSIPKLKHLRYLALSGCEFGMMHDVSLNRSYNLQTLVLRGCINVSVLLHEIKSLKSLRHLDLSHSDINRLPDSIIGLINLQTLYLYNCSKFEELHENIGLLVHLRFLDISGTSVTKLPDSIVGLINLQMLNVSSCSKFEELHENIGLLVQLSFLDISYTSVTKLPDSINRLSNLRILKIPRNLDALPTEFGALTQLVRLDLFFTDIKKLPESWTKTRCKLEMVEFGFRCELPRDIQNWPELKHFTHIRDDDIMPRGVEKLIYLETLKSYMVRKEGTQVCSGSIAHRSGIEELAALNSLQVLHIKNLENVIGGKVDAERAKLKDKQHIRELHLKWSPRRKMYYNQYIEEDDDIVDDDVLEGLEPHPNLRKLVIQGFVGYEFPAWIAGSLPGNYLLQNLVELELYNVHIDVELPALGVLPSLRVLQIGWCRMMSTKYLGICHVKNWEQEQSSSRKGKGNGKGKGKETKAVNIQICTTLFQSLVELKISSMQNLKALIAHFALLPRPFPSCRVTCKCFPSLEVLKIYGCGSLESMPLNIFSSIKNLELSHTHSWVTSLFLPPSIQGGGCLECLTSITIEYVYDLTYLPPLRVLLQNYAPKLEDLQISGCKKFRGFRDDDDLNSLCYSLSLRSLKLYNCGLLKSLPDLQSWTSLKTLEIWKCDKLKESLRYGLKSLAFLQILRVDFIQREEQQGRDLHSRSNLVNLME